MRFVQIFTVIWALVCAQAKASSPFGDSTLFSEHRLAISSALEAVVGRCGNPCIITFSRGGNVGRFARAALEVQASKQQIIVDGQCMSSCTVLASLAAEYVCITPRARFGFHKISQIVVAPGGGNRVLAPGQGLVGRDAELPLSYDVREWVVHHGGFPASTTHYNIMSFEEARRFWPVCSAKNYGRT